MAERPRFAAPAQPLLGTGFQMLGGGAALALASAALERPWALDLGAVPAASWWAWAYLVLFGSLVGYGAFSWLLRQDPPHLVGTYSYVNPLVAVLAGHFILGEAVSAPMAWASLLIVGSVALLLWLRRA
jgi:drug/metabolite transporter (DMT)-like permease